MRQQRHFSFCILHSAFCIVSAVAATTAMAAPPKPSPAFAAAKAAIGVRVAELDKAKKPFMECVAILEDLRATEPYATNAALKAEINERILSWCLLPGWTSLRRYDRESCTAKAAELCREVLASNDCSPEGKTRYAQTLAAILAGEKDFDGAERIAREQIARAEDATPPNARTRSNAWLLLADVLRWQDRAR